MASAMPPVNRHAQRLVAISLYIFQSQLTHRYAETVPFRRFGNGVADTQFLGCLQRRVNGVLQLLR